MASKYFAKSGSVAGWDQRGREVIGQYFPKSKSWAVWVDGLVLQTRQNFATAREADAAIEKMIVRKFETWD